MITHDNRFLAVALAGVVAVAPVAVPSAFAAERPVGQVDPAPLLRLVNDEAIKVEINIGPALLGILAAGFEDTEPELRDAVRGLEGIRTLIFDLSALADDASVDRSVNRIVEDLERGGWERTARVRDETSNLNVLIRGDGDGLARGLVVLINDRSSHELVFVNLFGRVDLAHLQALGGEMDLPGLDRVPAGEATGDSKDR